MLYNQGGTTDEEPATKADFGASRQNIMCYNIPRGTIDGREVRRHSRDALNDTVSKSRRNVLQIAPDCDRKPDPRRRVCILVAEGTSVLKGTNADALFTSSPRLSSLHSDTGSALPIMAKCASTTSALQTETAENFIVEGLCFLLKALEEW